MAIKFKNNASTTLAQDITNVSTSLVVAAGTGVLFPALGANDYFLITVVDNSGNNEIMKVTAINTDTLTVVRAQEGTAARAFAMNSLVELRLTAGAIQEILNVTYATPAEVSAGVLDMKAVSPATMSSANVASAVTATTASTCTGNAATASDMAAGHALAGATTAAGVLSKIAPAVTTPAKLDNSTKIATTAFVKSAAGALVGFKDITTSYSMTAEDIGAALYIVNAGTTITLIDPRTIPAGSTVVIIADKACTLATVAGTVIYSSSVPWLSSAGLTAGTTCMLLSAGNTWRVYGGSVKHSSYGEFANFLSGSGYQKLPSGLIIQWGVARISSINAHTITYPIAFPNAVFSVALSYEDGGMPDVYERYLVSKNTSSFVVKSYNGGGYSDWIAVGY